jgi:polysaccharide export outer membrane protein
MLKASETASRWYATSAARLKPLGGLQVFPLSGNRFRVSRGIVITAMRSLAAVVWIACACANGAVVPEKNATASYLLGAEDQINVRILEAPELAEKPIHIDPQGFIELPLAGRVKAAGLTTEQLQHDLTNRLKAYIKDPHVVVSIGDFRSQPVSVIGEVATPGLQQLKGRKTLAEVLSLAGGLKPDAGNTVKITRRKEYGPVPLPGAADDPTGQFSVAEVKLSAIIEAKDPQQNILIQPYDVVSVPKGEMVYVVGEVDKAGGFVLDAKERISVLQALSLAGGLKPNASPGSARILRAGMDGQQRVEIPVNVKRILEGRDEDHNLRPDDILFIPTSRAKPAAIRTLEAAITLGTGIVIWRR